LTSFHNAASSEANSSHDCESQVSCHKSCRAPIFTERKDQENASSETKEPSVDIQSKAGILSSAEKKISRQDFEEKRIGLLMAIDFLQCFEIEASQFLEDMVFQLNDSPPNRFSTARNSLFSAVQPARQ